MLVFIYCLVLGAAIIAGIVFRHASIFLHVPELDEEDDGGGLGKVGEVTVGELRRRLTDYSDDGVITIDVHEHLHVGYDD